MTVNDFLTTFALPHIALTQFKIRRWSVTTIFNFWLNLEKCTGEYF